MTHYTYIFTDLRTTAPLMEIPLSSVYLTDVQNDLGYMNGAFALDMLGYRNADLIDATIPGRAGVIVEREGTPIWDGFITSRWYQSQAKLMQFYAKTIKSYPQHVYIDSPFSREGLEQTQIFLDLWTVMQADVTRNIQVTLPGAIATSVNKTATVQPYEFKAFGSVMDDIANGDNGFDWNVLTVKSGDNYVRNLRMGYPYLGEPFSDDSVTLDYPGPITNYYETENQIATNTYGIGSGSGSAMLISVLSDTAQLVNGLRFDRSLSFKDVNDQALLNSLTQQAFNLDRPSSGPSVLKTTLKGDQVPRFGDYNLGDYLYVYIVDPRHPDGKRFNFRLVKWELRPSSSDAGDQVDLTFAGASV